MWQAPHFSFVCSPKTGSAYPLLHKPMAKKPKATRSAGNRILVMSAVIDKSEYLLCG
jgi:hypothetical protein